jgi:hypothetical protein
MDDFVAATAAWLVLFCFLPCDRREDVLYTVSTRDARRKEEGRREEEEEESTLTANC